MDRRAPGLWEMVPFSCCQVYNDKQCDHDGEEASLLRPQSRKTHTSSLLPRPSVQCSNCASPGAEMFNSVFPRRDYLLGAADNIYFFFLFTSLFSANFFLFPLVLFIFILVSVLFFLSFPIFILVKWEAFICRSYKKAFVSINLTMVEIRARRWLTAKIKLLFLSDSNDCRHLLQRSYFAGKYLTLT